MLLHLVFHFHSFDGRPAVDVPGRISGTFRNIEVDDMLDACAKDGDETRMCHQSARFSSGFQLA